MLLNPGFGQNVYERGTFVSLPAGKHVNHSYYSAWNAYFAVEDGVLVYDHQRGQWLEPITASNGLSQYPVLRVWQNAGTQDVWIVTPDYVFVYDELTDWMTRLPLPKDERFSGTYEIGISETQFIISSIQENEEENYSAVFLKNSGVFEVWGANSNLDVDWERVAWIEAIQPEFLKINESLPVQMVVNGSFDANGSLHLDGHPSKSVSRVSSIIGDENSGSAFLSTLGTGVFHRDLRGGQFVPLPFGLLSPDVMSLELFNDTLLVGGRAGLSILNGFHAEYDEAIMDVAYDYSFISAIDERDGNVLIAGRGGVFKKSIESYTWTRLISKKDLNSSRIYSLAAGNDGNIMVATERNAYLYHKSGKLLRTLFPVDLDWPVFNINYAQGSYYISTYFGLYIYNETSLSFIARVNSSGEMQAPNTTPAIDPVYKSVVNRSQLWASTHRGLVQLDLLQETGNAYLAPSSPFKPRGLSVKENKIWIGTDAGLYCYIPATSAWRHYTISDGLISNFVTDLIATDDYIWIGTNLGITRIKWRNLY